MRKHRIAENLNIPLATLMRAVTQVRNVERKHVSPREIWTSVFELLNGLCKSTQNKRLLTAEVVDSNQRTSVWYHPCISYQVKAARRKSLFSSANIKRKICAKSIFKKSKLWPGVTILDESPVSKFSTTRHIRIWRKPSQESVK